MFITSLVEIMADDYEESELCANMAEIMKKLTHFNSSLLRMPIYIFQFIYMFYIYLPFFQVSDISKMSVT